MIHEEFKLDNQLCFRLYTASRLLTQAYHPLLSEYGLTYPQYLVLLVLWEKDAQPVNDIAKRLFLETNTVTPLLQRMEKEGILVRRKGEKDARQMIVCPSSWAVPSCVKASRPRPRRNSSGCWTISSANSAHHQRVPKQEICESGASMTFQERTAPLNLCAMTASKDSVTYSGEVGTTPFR